MYRSAIADPPPECHRGATMVDGRAGAPVSELPDFPGDRIWPVAAIDSHLVGPCLAANTRMDLDGANGLAAATLLAGSFTTQTMGIAGHVENDLLRQGGESSGIASKVA